jgi:hypothetical protein
VNNRHDAFRKSYQFVKACRKQSETRANGQQVGKAVEEDPRLGAARGECEEPVAEEPGEGAVARGLFYKYLACGKSPAPSQGSSIREAHVG